MKMEELLRIKMYTVTDSKSAPYIFMLIFLILHLQRLLNVNLSNLNISF